MSDPFREALAEIACIGCSCGSIDQGTEETFSCIASRPRAEWCYECIAANALASELHLCLNCGSVKVTTEQIQQEFPYGVGEDETFLVALVPMRTCGDCGFSYTDADGEDARSEAVYEHLSREVKRWKGRATKAEGERIGVLASDVARFHESDCHFRHVLVANCCQTNDVSLNAMDWMVRALKAEKELETLRTAVKADCDTMTGIIGKGF